MKWSLSFLSDENIIFIETEGDASVADLNAMAVEINTAIIKYNTKYLLLDHRKIVLELSMLDLLERPVALKKIGIPQDAVSAEIVPDTAFPGFKFYESVSKNYGYNVSVFQEMDSARQWININQAGY